MIATVISGAAVAIFFLGWQLATGYIILVIFLTTMCWVNTMLSKHITKEKNVLLENLNMVSASLLIVLSGLIMLIADGHRINSEYSNCIRTQSAKQLH